MQRMWVRIKIKLDNGIHCHLPSEHNNRCCCCLASATDGMTEAKFLFTTILSYFPPLIGAKRQRNGPVIIVAASSSAFAGSLAILLLMGLAQRNLVIIFPGTETNQFHVASSTLILRGHCCHRARLARRRFWWAVDAHKSPHHRQA